MQSNHPRHTVIACTKQKQLMPAKAIELYDASPLFRLSVEIAQREGLRIFVLIASTARFFRRADYREALHLACASAGSRVFNHREWRAVC